MAEAAKGNGEAGAPLPGADPAEAPPLIINAQYVKDLSFENPRAPQSLTQPTAAPDVAINVDIKAHNLGPAVFEVVLTVNVDARAENEPLFLVELAYAAVVTVRNTSEAMLPGLILVETPRLIFPFARAIIADATRDGGFPPLMINPIDFSELLRRQPQAFAQVGGAGV
jgi:preprotein translocase subunit SecB